MHTVFGVETEREKETTASPRRTFEDNIQTDFESIDRGRTGLLWIRIKKSGFYTIWAIASLVEEQLLDTPQTSAADTVALNALRTNYQYLERLVSIVYKLGLRSDRSLVDSVCWPRPFSSIRLTDWLWVHTASYSMGIDNSFNTARAGS